MFGKIVVELKAVTRLADEHRAQVMNYLKAMRLQLGFVVNFGHHPKVEYSRLLAHDHWASNEPPDLRA
jgi:GxxExxY protein